MRRGPILCYSFSKLLSLLSLPKRLKQKQKIYQRWRNFFLLQMLVHNFTSLMVISLPGIECSWGAAPTLWIVNSACAENHNGCKDLAQLLKYFTRNRWPRAWYWFLALINVFFLLFHLLYLPMQALRHLKQIAQDISQSNVTNWGRRPAALRALSHRLSR